MRITSRIAALFLVFATAHSTAVNAAAVEASIAVVVCDDARAGKKNVVDVERVVSRIYRHARIDIQWVHGCGAAEGAALRLNIIAASVAADGPIAESVLGYAIASTGVANVRLDRIIVNATVHQIYQFWPSDAIGAVIAHELGHLLLGPGAHTNSGIMQANIDLGSAALWGPAFSRAQSATIVRTIAARNQRFLSGS
jgi:hypothetical protein